jgi:hypothetical protein
MTTPSEMFAEGQDQGTQNTQTGSEQTTNPQSDTMFIGEGKKYSSVNDADKALAFKDDHISKIEQENAALREQAASAKTIDDVVESIKNQTLERDTFDKTRQDDHQSVDMDALVAKTVEEKLAKAEQMRTASTNSQKVFDSLSKKYGEKAGEMYSNKAKELGIDLDDLARRSPTAVMEFFKDSSASPSATSDSYSSSSINTASLNSNQPRLGTVDYWDNLHSQGKISREEKFRQQHKSLEKMGAAAFYNK